MTMNRALVDQLKRDAPIDRVIAYLLRESGQRVSGDQVAFRCPWHSDESPSLHVHLTKNLGVYVCRACGEKGDVITFVQKQQGKTYGEAATRACGPTPATARAFSSPCHAA